MNYPIQALINAGVIPSVTFPTDSRYYGFSTLTYTDPSGNQTTYLARRFVPQAVAPAYSTLAQHSVVQGDRLDRLAAKYLGDPLVFWQLCDANGAMQPRELTETIGATIVVTMPQGGSGGPNP